uniref:Uncharacterized protein n=1 Tax=Acrobeloides nanus TaxID=290746 RepID=A0A914DVK4_9BILA
MLFMAIHLLNIDDKSFILVLATVVLGFQTPDFLQGASNDVKQQYLSIVQRTDLSVDQKKTMIDSLMVQQPQSIQTAYAAFKQQLDQIRAQGGLTVQQQMAKMQSQTV